MRATLIAAGLTAAGFGAGSALTVVPIANMIGTHGYEPTFWWFGLGQGIVVVIVALFLRAPQPGEAPAPAAPTVQQTGRDFTLGQVLRTSPFWVMYVMFIMVGTGGLMATAQLAPIADDFNVSKFVILFGLSTLSLAAIVARGRDVLSSVTQAGRRVFGV